MVITRREKTRLVKDILVASIVLPISIVSLAGQTAPYEAGANVLRPELKLVRSLNLPGSFVSSQSIYADAERIFAASYQGDLFVLERDRQAGYSLLETIHFGAPLTAVRGDEDNVYIAGTDGSLYRFSKTWPIRFLQVTPLSNYGLNALHVTGQDLYVAKGQAVMTAYAERLFISQLNPGDIGLDLTSMRTYAEAFVPNSTLVFDRRTLRTIGAIPNPFGMFINMNAAQGFLYLTTPGCCGRGISVYDASTLSPVQFLNRTANTVAPIKRRGMSLLAAGGETGAVDLYAFSKSGYELVNSADLPALTGFSGPEDIEIRSMWADGLDNLVFAGSSWGNDRSRGPLLPSFFVLEIHWNSGETE
jgi:hypothetical protein